MDDNARPDGARITTTFPEGHNLNHKEWPSFSPDLNPIENIYTIFENNVRNHESSVSTVDELIISLQDECTNIGPLVTRNAIQNMRQYCNDCVRLGGTATS